MMSETLNNNQNGGEGSAPTGWEQMENYTPEPIIAQDAQPEEETSRRRGHETSKILSRIQFDQLPEDVQKHLQEEMRNSIIETIIDNTDWSGDKAAADAGHNNAEEDTNLDIFADTDEDKMRYFEEVSNGELAGFAVSALTRQFAADIRNDNDSTASEHDTKPPITDERLG